VWSEGNDPKHSATQSPCLFTYSVVYISIILHPVLYLIRNTVIINVTN
jgi:hypothetical protein